MGIAFRTLNPNPKPSCPGCFAEEVAASKHSVGYVGFAMELQSLRVHIYYYYGIRSQKPEYEWSFGT